MTHIRLAVVVAFVVSLAVIASLIYGDTKEADQDKQALAIVSDIPDPDFAQALWDVAESETVRTLNREVPIRQEAVAQRQAAEQAAMEQAAREAEAQAAREAEEERRRAVAAQTTQPPPRPAQVTTAAPTSHHSTGSINGYPCGGDLPPCWVLQRESGGNPLAENPSSSASGLWQFIDSTWAGFGGYSHASYAPVSVQNEKARQLWAGGQGCSHWSAC